MRRPWQKLSTWLGSPVRAWTCFRRSRRPQTIPVTRAKLHHHAPLRLGDLRRSPAPDASGGGECACLSCRPTAKTSSLARTIHTPRSGVSAERRFLRANNGGALPRRRYGGEALHDWHEIYGLGSVSNIGSDLAVGAVLSRDGAFSLRSLEIAGFFPIRHGVVDASVSRRA